MKIVEITPITPWKENRGGTSALQYHLLTERPKDIDIEIWSFNFNELSNDEIKIVENELGVNIHLMKKPWFRTFTVDNGLNFVRLLLKYPIFNYIWLSDENVKKIDSLRADGVWIYGEEMGRISKQLGKYKRVHTFPDAQSLYYERLGGIRKMISGGKYMRMERVMDRNVIYHLVGEEDVEWFKKMAPGVDARFIRHPHYELVDKKVGFGKKIKLLVAGRNDIYMRRTADEMIEVLQEVAKIDEYEVMFLGKGWTDGIKRLRQVGYNVTGKDYVEDYVSEVAKYDVQISPLSVGTGTKGKALDAMANGVLVVGTDFALENIVEGGVLYKCKKDLKRILLDIMADKGKYEQMAMTARDNVRREHGRGEISHEFFGLWR